MSGRKRTQNTQTDASKRVSERRSSATNRRSGDEPKKLNVPVWAVVLIVIAIALFGLYVPGKEYYHALRDQQRLENELALNEARNAQMKEKVDGLQTPQGIEDEARENYGLVLPGENAVNVVEESTQTSPPVVTEDVKAGSGQAPSTWYYDALDAIFDFE